MVSRGYQVDLLSQKGLQVVSVREVVFVTVNLGGGLRIFKTCHCCGKYLPALERLRSSCVGPGVGPDTLPRLGG